jgi:hypothetical protein
MKKVLAIAVAAVSMMGMIGCGVVDPTNKDDVSIVLGTVNAITAGASSTLTGTVTTNIEVTSTAAAVTDSATGTTIATTVINAVPVSLNGKKDKQDLSVAITTFAATPAGTYKLSVTIEAGTASQTKYVYFKVNNTVVVPNPATKSAALTMGSNQNNAGGSINLDIPQLYTGAQAASGISTIDLCYANTSSGDKLGTPSWAKASTFDFTDSRKTGRKKK